MIRSVYVTDNYILDSGKRLQKRSAGETNPSPCLHGGFPLPAAHPGLRVSLGEGGGSSLPLALGVGGLEDAGGRHEVLDVLTEDLVLRLQLQVLLLDRVDSC